MSQDELLHKVSGDLGELKGMVASMHKLLEQSSLRVDKCEAMYDHLHIGLEQHKADVADDHEALSERIHEVNNRVTKITGVGAGLAIAISTVITIVKELVQSLQ